MPFMHGSAPKPRARVCPACKRLSVVDLSAKLDMHRCKECQGQLTLLEGLAQDIPCPECSKTLRSTNLGVTP